jgi:hypothetical protein
VHLGIVGGTAAKDIEAVRGCGYYLRRKLIDVVGYVGELPSLRVPLLDEMVIWVPFPAPGAGTVRREPGAFCGASS